MSLGTLRDIKLYSEQIEVQSVDDFDALPVPERSESNENPGQVT